MDEQEWCRTCRSIHETARRRVDVDPDMLRDRLATLDRHMRAAPWNLLTNFDQLQETELSLGAERRAEEIEAGGFGWRKMPVSPKQTLLALATEIRAVDELLARLDTRYSRIPADPAAAWRSRDGGAFVIPSRRGRDLGSRDGDGLSYGRRGTLMHRVVPSSVHGMKVRPITLAALQARPGSDALPLGAGLFPGMRLVTTASTGGFLAAAVEHPDLGAALGRQIAGLAGAAVLVWPELTLDDGSVELLGSALADLAFEREDMPDVVVAGSWHRARGDAFRNVAPVLDGTGGRRDEYAKVAIFQSDQLGSEDIEAGTEILVIACDRFLATVAICKDYCGLGSASPWRELDVDLLLVPSMGGTATMEGHLTRANQDRIEHGSRAFVVQQAAVRKDGEPDGFVLPAPSKPPKNAADVASDAEWKRYDM
jgi:hypothetical protein